MDSKLIKEDFGNLEIFFWKFSKIFILWPIFQRPGSTFSSSKLYFSSIDKLFFDQFSFDRKNKKMGSAFKIYFSPHIDGAADTVFLCYYGI